MTHRRLGVLLLSVAAAAPVIVGAQVRQPGATLRVEQLQAQAFHVSAGKRLKPKAWPNGARVAVGLTFDVDNVSPALNGYTTERSKQLFERMEDALAALPGVSGVTTGTVPLLSGSMAYSLKQRRA